MRYMVKAPCRHGSRSFQKGEVFKADPDPYLDSLRRLGVIEQAPEAATTTSKIKARR